MAKTEPVFQSSLGLESTHFRIVPCGLPQGVLLGAFPTLAEVVIEKGLGFIPETPFTVEVGEPYERDFRERVRVAAKGLLIEAEEKSKDWCRESAGSRIWQRLAEDALRPRRVPA